MPDDVQMLGAGELLLSGPAVLWFATVAERAVHGQRANGARNPVAERWLTIAVEASNRTRTAASGRPAVPPAPVSSSSRLVDPIGASEAAVIMNRKARNVRDLCKRGSFESAQQTQGRWQIERAEVLARAERRAG